VRLDRDAVAGEHDGGGAHVGLQRVDAQVDGGAVLHRAHRRLEGGAEARLEVGLEEIGQVEADGARGVGEVGREPLPLVRLERGGVEAAAGEELVERHPLARGMGEHEPPAAPAAEEGVGAPAAQAVEDDVAHRRAVLGAGEAARARPAGQRALGGLSLQDGVQKLDRGGEAGGGCHRRWSARKTRGVQERRRRSGGVGVGRAVPCGGAGSGLPAPSGGGGRRRRQAATRPPSTSSTCSWALVSAMPPTAATSRVSRSSAAS
jgi:hypothetical protein